MRNRERAALSRSFTWHFSMQGLPFRPVTQAGTEALTSRFHPYALKPLPHLRFIFSPVQPDAKKSAEKCKMFPTMFPTN